MNEQTISQPSPDQLSDILLVLDKEKKKIQAVAGVDENGELKAVDATKKNQSQFMRVDRQGDIFTNFFSNFFRQLKDPTRFAFFHVPEANAVDTAKKMQQQVDKPTNEGEQLMDNHKVNADLKQNNQNGMETPQAASQTGEYRYKPEQIDWETMSNLGLSREKLEKMNVLDSLLKGYKTDLVPVSVNLGTTIIRTDARLSLQQDDKGDAVVAIHGIRKEPNLNFKFFGHEFTQEDKDNLMKTGNMGRVVDLVNPKTNETIPSIISLDRQTNELVALRTDKIKVPDEIKGVKLDEQQKQTLMEGKPLFVEGMISKKGDPFNATVQFNADKRYVEFLFDRSLNSRQTQGNAQGQSQEPPRVFRGKELDDQQYQKFKEGEDVYVSGLVDKKGNPYQGYITFNKETGKTDFSFGNPAKLKEKVQPMEAHKTQVAVNSDGKTNEATKNIKEPLKSGQQAPENEKQQQQQEEAGAPNKAKKPKLA